MWTLNVSNWHYGQFWDGSLWTFETFWLVQAIMTKRSAFALRLPNWSKLTIWAFLTARLPISWFLGKYHSEMKCFFALYWSRNVYCCWIVIDPPRVNAENRKLLETSRRFCETLVGHIFFKCDEISQSTPITVKTMLVFLEYIFQFFINKVLPV